MFDRTREGPLLDEIAQLRAALARCRDALREEGGDRRRMTLITGHPHSHLAEMRAAVAQADDLLGVPATRPREAA